MRRGRGAAVAVAAAIGLGATAWGAAPAGADPLWRLEQPPPPPGARFKVPLGRPGDMQFYARNRGLLMVEGNSTIPRGIYAWNGANWHELATVCGGPGDTARIAFAGPDEWWTVSEPSRPRIGSGTALCHFKDRQVVASYSTPFESADPIQQMDAAACNGPGDCWFGGFDARSPTGDRRGAFHLHWDGTALKTVYAPHGHGVSDLEFQDNTLFESSFLGPRPENTSDQLDPPDSSADPALIHRIAGGQFADDPFVPADKPDGSELLGLDSDGTQLWAVGGGAASGTSTPDGTSIERAPLAARLTSGAFQEVTVNPARFGTNDRFGDVAAVPGTDTAWAAVQPFSLRRSSTSKAVVARLSPAGVLDTTTLPASGAGRGVAARVAFSDPGDGWLVTYAGWLFHYTDGTSPEPNNDPAWQGTTSFRPNESAEQFVPDSPPPDNSQLFAPPPVEVETPPTNQEPGKPLPALLKHVRTKVKGTRLIVTFQLVRKAKVALVAKRKGKVVARTKTRSLKKGRHKLVLKLRRRHWPTRIQFKTHEPGQNDSPDDSISTKPAR